MLLCWNAISLPFLHLIFKGQLKNTYVAEAVCLIPACSMQIKPPKENGPLSILGF